MTRSALKTGILGRGRCTRRRRRRRSQCSRSYGSALGSHQNLPQAPIAIQAPRWLGGRRLNTPTATGGLPRARCVRRPQFGFRASIKLNGTVRTTGSKTRGLDGAPGVGTIQYCHAPLSSVHLWLWLADLVASPRRPGPAGRGRPSCCLSWLWLPAAGRPPLCCLPLPLRACLSPRPLDSPSRAPIACVAPEENPLNSLILSLWGL